MKKLEEVRELIKGVRTEDLEDFLWARGFSGSLLNFMYHKKKKVVVKLPWFSTNRIPKEAVPTLKIRRKNDLIVIQPYCKKASSVKKFNKFIKDEIGFDSDLDTHHGNVRMYRNRPRLIDW